ncbi:hypothetical protein [Rubrivivax rivuli]|uniref:Galactose oxidase n=1 Tax=Rubrivivax rivuli TaxID=1862385 RepID=A0A437RHR3_9BURK|nr:hypothetical protein [Rubrivivax rivuli]RVU46312.1 hypothetical protein EOE66_10740 [Rubrivivax rivuli]
MASPQSNTSVRIAWLHGLMVIASVLTGCGGGGGPDEVSSIDTAAGAASAPAVRVLRAAAPGCDQLSVHDSGTVVYVVAARNCPASAVGLKLGLAAPSEALAQAVDVDLRYGEEKAEVLIPGLGLRQVGLFRAGQWRELPNSQTWQPRDGAGLLALNGSLYLLGGWLWGPVTNEFWRTRDLVHWEFLGHAPWPARHGSAWLVHGGRLWVIGGDLYADVWSSSDGVTWDLEQPSAPFGRRYTPNAASLNGRIVVYAGQSWNGGQWCQIGAPCEAEAPRDVWSSADGRVWRLETAQAPWAGRGLIHGSLVWDGQIFLLGGGLKAVPAGSLYSETVFEATDVWSSRDGVTWQLRSDQLGFAGRTHASVVASSQGCYVSDGSVGTQVNVVNDVYFAPD